MTKTWVELRRQLFLPKSLFWQARGFFLSFTDYCSDETVAKGKIADVTQIKPPPAVFHPLLVAEIPSGKVILAAPT